MAYTYQDAQNLSTLITTIGGTPIDLTVQNEVGGTRTDIYWVSNQDTIARSNVSLGDIRTDFTSSTGTTLARVSITSSTTDLYFTVLLGALPWIQQYNLSPAGAGNSWFGAAGRVILAYNSDNSQVYVFPRQTQTNTSITYNRYNTSGTLLGTHTLTTPVVAATYDNVRNRFYLQGNDRIAAFSVGTDHTLTADTSNDISSPSGFTIGRGIAYHNNTIYSIGSTTSFTTALGRFTVTQANTAPTVTTTIPNQTVSATTTADLNLPDYFDGRPAPTFSLGTGAPSFVSIDGDTLDIEPQASDVRAAVYAVTVTATNSEGTASDEFNITVTVPSLLVAVTVTA